MSFPAYDLYQHSGIDWLGTVPVGWSVKSIKRIASIQYGIGEPPKYQEEGTRLVRATNIRRGIISDEGMVFVDPTHIPEQRIVWLNEGDIIVVRSGAYTGDSAIIPNGYGKAIAGFDMVLRIHDAVPRFVQYALLSNYVRDGQLDLMRMRAAQPHLNAEELGGCQFVAPPLDEQKAISSFLDVETSKIDGLVSEQRRLIELLKEKRQAVISHAVTKGLNPNAPMKPSGIQWLGDVPQHWEVAPLRRLISRDRRITYGIVQPGQPDENGRYMVRGQDYSFGWADPQTVFRVSDAIEEPYKRSRLRSGDLVMTIVGAGIGNVAVVPDWLDGANITQTTSRIAVDPEKADSRFVRAVLDGPVGKRSVGFYAKGAAQPGLNLEHVKLFPITLPPLEEQSRIADYLASTLSRFNSLEAEAERAIELLQERRTALISAAVTGKIDVRGFAPVSGKALAAGSEQGPR